MCTWRKIKQDDKVRNTHLGAGYTRHLQMFQANNPISFPVVISTLNEGRVFLDMALYVVMNITALCDEEENNNNDNKSNNSNNNNNNSSYQF